MDRAHTLPQPTHPHPPPHPGLRGSHSKKLTTPHSLPHAPPCSPIPTLLNSGQEATVAPAQGPEQPGWRLFVQLSGVCVQSFALISLISRKHGTHCLPTLGPGPEPLVLCTHQPSLIKRGRVEGTAPPRHPTASNLPVGPGKVTEIPISGAPTREA